MPRTHALALSDLSDGAFLHALGPGSPVLGGGVHQPSFWSYRLGQRSRPNIIRLNDAPRDAVARGFLLPDQTERFEVARSIGRFDTT